MTGDLYCLLGLGLSLIALALMIALIRWMPRTRIFHGWRDVLEAWRSVHGAFETTLFFVLLAKYLLGGVATTLIIPVVLAALTIGTSLCGISPDALKVGRDMLNDVLNFLERLKH